MGKGKLFIPASWGIFHGAFGQDSRFAPVLLRGCNFLHAIRSYLMKKVRTGGELFHKVLFKRAIKVLSLNLAGRATTDQTLTIKYSRRDVDYRVNCEIRSGLGRRR